MDLRTGLQTAFAARPDPIDRIHVPRDEPRPRAPGGDELSGPSAAGDAVDHDRFASFVMVVHDLEEALDLRLGGDPVVGNVDVVIGEVLWYIPTVVELAAVHDGANLLLPVDIEYIGIRPP